MSSNKRVLLLVAGIAAVAVVGFMAFNFISGILETFTNADNKIADKKAELAALNIREAKLVKSEKALNIWKNLALPNAEEALNDYRKFLQELLKKPGIVITMQPTSEGSLRSGLVRNQTITHQSYRFNFTSKMPQLTAFLKEFYSFNLPHTIKSMVVTPTGAGSDSDLALEFKVEVLTMPATGKPRPTMLATPEPKLLAIDVLGAMKRNPLNIGLSMATWVSPTGLIGHFENGPALLASNLNTGRKYEVLNKKNMFAGLTAPQAPTVVTKEEKVADKSILGYIQTCSVTITTIKEEALARNKLTNTYFTLRPDGGVNEFEIKDKAGMLVLKGKVLSVLQKEVIVAIDNKPYSWKIGETLAEALKHEVNNDYLKKLEITWKPTAAKTPEPAE